MKTIQKYWILSLILLLFINTHPVLAENTYDNPILNPAAVYCDSLGYQYNIITDSAGQYGVCKLPDKEVVDEWKFFLGDTGVKYNYCSLKGYKTETSTDKSDTYEYLTNHAAVCVVSDNSRVEVGKLMKMSYDLQGFSEAYFNRPVFDSIDDIQTTEGSPIEITLHATDPNNDPLTFSVATPPAGATLNGNVFQWTPDFNQAGIYKLPFTVSDGRLESFQILTITVNDVVQNKPPELNNPGDQTITEGNTLRLNLVATDPDNNPLTYSFNSIKSLLGAIISGNTFTWTPGSGSAGTYPVTFKATDTGGLSDEETIKISVAIPTNVKIVPKTINLGSKGYFLAFVTLPEAYKGAMIDKDTVSCEGAPAQRMMRLKLFPRVVGFVFKTSELKNVQLGNKVTLNVKGELKNKGTTYTFTGTDSIKVISKPSWQPDDIKDISKESDDQLFKKFNI